MPPSGFSQIAINGLLTFVRSAYENTLERYRGRDLSEETVLNDSIGYLDGIVRTSAPLATNGTVSREGIEGLATFVTTNYKDLIAEIHIGKKTEGIAMKTEIEHISGYLEKFKI